MIKNRTALQMMAMFVTCDPLLLTPNLRVHRAGATAAVDLQNLRCASSGATASSAP